LSILRELIDFGFEFRFVGCFYTTPIFWHNFALAFKIVNWTVLNSTAQGEQEMEAVKSARLIILFKIGYWIA